MNTQQLCGNNYINRWNERIRVVNVLDDGNAIYVYFYVIGGDCRGDCKPSVVGLKTFLETHIKEPLIVPR